MFQWTLSKRNFIMSLEISSLSHTKNNTVYSFDVKLKEHIQICNNKLKCDTRVKWKKNLN